MERGRRLFNHCRLFEPCSSLSSYLSLFFYWLHLSFSYSLLPHIVCTRTPDRKLAESGFRNTEYRHLHFTRENTFYGPGPIIAPHPSSLSASHAYAAFSIQTSDMHIYKILESDLLLFIIFIHNVILISNWFNFWCFVITHY